MGRRRCFGLANLRSTARYLSSLAPMVAALALVLLTACSGVGQPPVPTPIPLAEELIFYDWAGDLIETVFDDFEKEYAIRVTYVIYETQEAAMERIRAGEQFDLVVLENAYIPSLVDDDLLAKIALRNVPNFGHISANFRDLAYDPGKKHVIPYSWGTTGLVVRSDMVEESVSSWSDMWDPRYADQV